MINPYNALLFSLKEERSADLFCSVREASHEGHLLCDCIYMKCPTGKSIDQWLPGTWGEERESLILGMMILFGMRKMFRN